MVPDCVIHYLPVTLGEAEETARRVERGEPLTGDEVARLEHESPIILGEVLITANWGHVIAKRYHGLDLAEL